MNAVRLKKPISVSFPFVVMLGLIALLAMDRQPVVPDGITSSTHVSLAHFVETPQPIEQWVKDPSSLYRPSVELQKYYSDSYTSELSKREWLDALSKRYGLPPGLLYYQNLIEASGKCPMSANSKGAVGCYQFLPETAMQFGLSGERGDFSANFYASADAAARYLTWLTIYLYGEKADTGDWAQLRHALAAYNAGPARVKINGRISLPSFYETISYVYRIESLVKGHAVWVERGDTLGALSKRTGVREDLIVRGNFSIRSGVDLKAGMVLYLPDEDGMSKLVVQRGMNLFAVQENTGIRVKDIAAANGLLSANLIRTGSVLKIPTL